MNKKTFYIVVTKQLDAYDESINGLKDISIYDIKDNVPALLTTIEVDIENVSDSEAEDWLIDNGHGEDGEINIVCL